MSALVRKCRALYGVYAQDWLAYKANGVIWILTDMVTAVTMPFVWANIAATQPVAGYTSSAFVVYYIAMLVVGSFVSSHLMWEIGWEIKEGTFTTYLVRPFDFFTAFFMRNFAWRTIRALFTLPFLLLLGAMYWNYLGSASVYLGWQFWVALLLGHLVSLSFVVAIAAAALWIEEAFTVFELSYFPNLFLSGYMFPIDVMPHWVRSIAQVLPFYYTTGVPVELLVGKVEPQAAIPMMGIQVVWIVILSLIAKAAWAKGLKHYSGVGI